MAHRDALLTQLLDRRRDFEARGGRFLGPALSELELERESIRAEARVLATLLEAYTGEADALVAYAPRDPQSPLFEFASDLLVVTPRVGCVLVEVKSHRVRDIRLLPRGQGLAVVYEGRGQPKPVVRQLFNAMSHFIDALRERANRVKLPRPPVTGVIAFPRVSRSELIQHLGEPADLPLDHLLLEESLEPARVRELFLRAARNSCPKQRMTLPVDVRTVELVDRTLGGLPPELRRTRRYGQERTAGCMGAAIDRLRDSSCLTPDQRELANRTLEGRPTLLRGVAGSGKSILLAKGLVDMLAGSREEGDARAPRLLVTCFNRTLAPLLRRDIEAFALQARCGLDSAAVEIVHFEGLLGRLRDEWGVEVPSFREMPDDKRLPQVLAQVETLFESNEDLEHECLWDFVFVDEAQDLDPEALRLLQRLSRSHPKTNERGIAIFYDDAQNLYGRPRPVWRDLGIHVTGGRTVLLQRSRRTSRPIATFAFNVLLGTAADAAGPIGTLRFADVASLRESDLITEVDAGVVIEFAQRPGPAPELVICSDPASEVDEVVTRIRDLIQLEKVRPEEIIVQTADRWEYLELFKQGLEAAQLAVHHVKKERDRLITSEGRITLSTIHSAKGYDAPISFVVGAQQLGLDPESRARLYVGATRAQLKLVVTGHGNPDGLLAEMRRVVHRLPELRPGIV